MRKPKVTVLLITVRPEEGAYIEHPDWHVLSKVVDDLNAQTFKDFELIVVDGVDRGGAPLEKADFCYDRIKPKENLWTRNRKCCISNYRNTGLAWARGELVINLDDCCYLPPVYLQLFWQAWNEHKICLSATWPHNGDQRIPRNDILNPDVCFVQKQAAPRGQVFGFGSYPLEAALQLNGYDEAYDGGMGLEDIDWGCRLADAGLSQHFAYVPGFRLFDQSRHDPDVINLKHPLSKCCNASWQTQQVWRTVSRANTPDLWPREAIERLVGPCKYMKEMDGQQMCVHWGCQQTCEYVKEQYQVDGKSFALELDELAAKVFEEPPVRDIRKEREDG